MSWFPVDDAFHGHPKARKAGLEALGLWTVSGSYCMAYLTDGFVPEWFVREKPRGMALAKRLIAAGLWRQGVNAEGEPGFWFHDWKPECTKAHILDVREKARLRKSKQRESQRESRVTDGVSHGDVPSTTQPNPTQPINPLVDLGGEVTQVGPSEQPPQFCPKHPNGTDTPCWACKSYRETFEAWEITSQSQSRHAAAMARDEAIRRCGRCDQNGLVEVNDDGDLARCSHQEAVNG